MEKHSIVSVGSYGQLKDKVNRYYFEAGMDSMMEELEPEIVLVYSKMPNQIDNGSQIPRMITNYVERKRWLKKIQGILRKSGK